MTVLRINLLVVGLVLVTHLAACQAQTGGTASPSLLDQAGKEATRIVQQAEATAMVLKAQAKATQIAAQAVTGSGSPTPAPTLSSRVKAEAQETPTTTSGAEEKESQDQNPSQVVEIVGVGFAADGGFISVQFRAPKEVAEKWWQGNISVIDEGTGTVYNEIPVMPVLGPLLSKPKLAGQVGYVMLVNQAPGLQSGALVTVILGDYRFEHVPVE